MDWIPFAGVACVAALLLLAPGAVLGRLLGLRGVIAWASAPALSAGIVVLASIVLGAAHVGWSPASFSAITLLCWGLALLLSRWLPKPARRAEFRRVTFAAAMGVGIGAVLITTELVIAFGAPGNISQHFDVVFHLNAVRFIMDTGNASPFVLGTLNGGTGSQSFYPSAWHAFVSLAAQATGTSIPVAVNATSLAMAALVWPLGTLALTRVVAGPRPIALILAGILAAGFGEFPMLLLDWGVLYADFFAVTLLPAVLALVYLALGVQGARGDLRRFRPRYLVAVAPALLGLMGAHPSALAALVVCVLPALVAAQWSRFRRSRAPHRRVELALTVALTLGGLVIIWSRLRPVNGFPGWEPTMSPGRALLGIAATSLTSGTPPWLIAPFVLIGWGAVFLTRRIWLGVSYAGTLLLFFVAAAVPHSLLRTLLTDAWYQDVYRLAAVVIVLAVPLAAIGAELVMRRGAAAVARRRRLSTALVGRRRQLLGIGVAAVLGIVAVPGPHIARQIEKTQAGYSFDAQSLLLTPQKLRFLDDSVSRVPPGSVIADNPWDGSALAYALVDRRVVTAHLLEIRTPDQQLVDRGLSNIGNNPRVCAAAHRLHVGYALALGSYLSGDPETRSYPGLDNLQSSDGMTLIASDGPARLYRLRPCDDGVTVH